ncbi:hypothetical protein BC828DRAFT_383175 [Blastocladiella britannica]|nr:hypothetical protein BC828DRAFT_383175 [Blastocladiella britannica]
MSMRIEVTKSSVPWTPEFVRAATLVTIVSLVTSVVATGFSIAADGSTNTLLSPTGQKIAYVVYDLCMWLALWIMQRWHFSLDFKHPFSLGPLRGIRAVTLAMIIGSHVVRIMYPFNTTFTGLSDAADSVLLNLVFTVALRTATFWVAKRDPDKVPQPVGGHQQWSPILPCFVIGLLIYMYSAYEGLTSLGIVLRVVAAGLGLLALSIAFFMENTLARHVDYSILVFLAYSIVPVLQASIVTLANTTWGQSHALYILLAFRLTLASFSLLLDDLMFASFGRWQLWGTFFLRFGEALVSCTASLNSASSLADAAAYLATNLFMSSFKDSGCADDLRDFFRFGYSIFSPPALVAERYQRLMQSGLPHVKQPGSNTGPVPEQQQQHHSISWLARTLHCVHRNTRPDPSDLHFSLRLQVGRSEQTLIARASSLLCVTSCFLVSWGWGRTVSHKMVIRTDPGAVQVALAILVGTVIELAASRMLAVVVFRRKFGMLIRIRNAVGEAAAGVDRRPSVTPSLPASIMTTSNTIKSVASGSASINPLVSSPPRAMSSRSETATRHKRRSVFDREILDVWTTGLPDEPLFFRLLLIVVAFMSANHFGCW